LSGSTLTVSMQIRELPRVEQVKFLTGLRRCGDGLATKALQKAIDRLFDKKEA